MQLVQDDELKPPRVRHDLGIDGVLPSQQELRHHEVGQENIRRILRDPLAFLLILLSGVTPDHRPEILRKA